ncbi:MAG: PfkB family carbohydrate kinase [Desulfurococcaceae archaeon]
MKKYIHVSVGNINIDIALYLKTYPLVGENVFASDIDIRPGGAASNYAIAVAQYGHQSYLIASASTHPFVEVFLQALRSRGVYVDRVKVVDSPPGIVVILIGPNGERTMINYPGANVELTPDDIPSDITNNAHVLHMASISADRTLEISRRFRSRGLLITYDPGPQINSLQENLRVLEFIDALFVNRKEFERIREIVSLEEMFKHGLHQLIVKKGAEGAILLLPSGTCYSGRAEPIKKPIDTTGAGDAFDAFFNAKYIESKDPAIALRYALAAGALKVGYKGSGLILDHKLLSLQLDKTIVMRSASCEP